MSQQKIAIVTGAGTGVGKAAAIALAGAGWKVVLAGRRQQPLDELAHSLGQAGSSLVVPTDVANPDSVAAMFATTVKTCGRVDLLFNNAGVSAPGVPLDELSIEQWGRHQLERYVLLLAAGFQGHEIAGSYGRAHHQQRFYFSLCAAP